MNDRIRRGSAALAAVALVATTVVLTSGHADDATTAARQRFFGHENVDPDTGAVRDDAVILSWFGVTNFAAAIGGHVVLLDAWIPRGEYSGYVPVSIDDLVALDPSHIFLGHGHFDHAADAAEIAAESGAQVVGTPEHCIQIADQDDLASCEGVVPLGSDPGEIAQPDVLDGVETTVLKHVHSAAEPPDTSEPHLPSAPPPDANAVVRHLPAPQDTAHLMSHLGDGEGDSLLWRFTVGDFTLTWHDSSGPLKERAPGVLAQIEALGETDVEVGAIMGFNQITNGMRDPRMYTERIAPKIFVPAHHDNWAPGISTRGENYEPIVREEYAKIENPPLIRWISDPQDYVRPQVLTFDIDSPFWD